MKTIVSEHLTDLNYDIESEFRFWIEGSELFIEIEGEEGQFDKYSLHLSDLAKILHQLGFTEALNGELEDK